MNRSNGIFAALSLLALSPATAQDLARRVGSAGDGVIQFNFSARSGVCGNGRTFMRVDDGSYYGSYSTGSSLGEFRDLCAPGPVRVVIVRAGSEVVKVESYAGPLVSDPNGGRDLGTVSSRDAAAYLLGLAATLDGRPAREAILPAMLADSALVTQSLLALVNDQSRSRDVRRNAISWLSRRRAEAGGVGTAAVTRALDRLLRDRNENESIRSQVLSTISNLDRGEGVPTLIEMARESDAWLSKQSFGMLARSGDPRARDFVRASLTRTDMPDDSRLAAIQGLAGDYATTADIRMLRDLYPKLENDRERDAVMNAVATAGGSDNNAWLLSLAQSPTEPAQRRRRAVTLLGRSDDPRVKDALKGLVGADR